MLPASIIISKNHAFSFSSGQTLRYRWSDVRFFCLLHVDDYSHSIWRAANSKQYQFHIQEAIRPASRPEDKRAGEGLAVDSPILKQINFWVIPWRQALKAAIEHCGHAIYKMSHLGHVGYQAYIKNRFHLLNVFMLFSYCFSVFLFFFFKWNSAISYK